MIAKTRSAGPPKFFVHLIFIVLVIPSQLSAGSSSASDSMLELHAGWMLQSSCKLKSSGEAISAPGFRTDGWHSVRVPSTVVAALVADKMFADPYFGQNLRAIPGTSYPVG